MQNTKDTFYLTLQSRLATINPARTIVLRGLTRPGTLVDENELPTAATIPDAFRLEWTRLQVTPASPLPLVALECAIHYATDGGDNSMARGRALAQMDAELTAALTTAPHAVAKMNYAATPPAAMQTSIFWADPLFGPIVTSGERLARTATVVVYTYQEAGEL